MGEFYSRAREINPEIIEEEIAEFEAQSVYERFREESHNIS